jgi:hypothetical protein
VFHSVGDLQESIQNYIEHHNRQPKPYLCTAQANDILEKVKRAWYRLKARGFNRVARALASIERRLGAEPSADPCPTYGV